GGAVLLRLRDRGAAGRHRAETRLARRRGRAALALLREGGHGARAGGERRAHGLGRGQGQRMGHPRRAGVVGLRHLGAVGDVHAFGQPPPFTVIWMAYFVGTLGNLLPLPGGLGGVEGGMIGAFAAFGVDVNLAVIAVLSYRGISFWLPTLPGAIA